MKGKRGDGNSVHVLVNVMVAVVCIVLLGGLAVLVYKTVVSNEYTSAKKAIELVEMKINALHEGEYTQLSIQSPCKDADKCRWTIFAFGKEDVGKKPERCYFDSCICICKNGESIWSHGEIYDSTSGSLHENVYGDKGICQNTQTGICRKIDTDIIKSRSIPDAGAISLGHSEIPYIPLWEPLVELRIEKGKDSVDIKRVDYPWSEKDDARLKEKENVQKLS